MGLWFDITRLAALVNVVLLLGLGSIWARNYRRLGSKHALGLLVFAALMFAENGLALYYFTMDPSLHEWFKHQMVGSRGLAMMLLRVLTTGALLFLAWITWD
ncbi:MAG: hypothetical protein ABEJ42_10635 [Halobacteriaceae archaeon]